MKKRRQILLVLIGITLILTACSNANTTGTALSGFPSSAGKQGASKEGKTASEDSSSSPTAEKEKSVAEKDKLWSEVPQEAENTRSECNYPSVAEISTMLEDGEGNVYWLAPNPTVPDVCQTLNAETANTEALWDTIIDRVFENTSMIEEARPDKYSYRCYQFNWNNQSWDVQIGKFSIELRSDASIDGDIQDSILNILTEWTKMSLSFETGKIEHYVFTYNGLTLDEYGYSPGGDEWISDSIVSLSDDRIFICNPIVIRGDCETIETGTFLTMDSAHAIYEAYRMASGVPSVSAITGVELVYYFRDGQLLPAWRLTGQIYMSPNGFDLNALLDAVTGEIIRSS